MSKNKIIFEKKDEMSKDSEIINEIQKTVFFKWMQDNGYDFKTIQDILDGNKINSFEQNRFNSTIKKAKEQLKVNITESVIFLEESFTKFKKILLVLDNETKFELKKELSKNFRIKLDENNLKQILE